MKDVLGNLTEIFAENPILNYVADMCVTVSVVILFLLSIRPLMKRLPRIGMYVLWFMIVLRIVCPVTINGIYGVLPEQVEKTVSEANGRLKMETLASYYKESAKVEYAGEKNSYRLVSQEKELRDGNQVTGEKSAARQVVSLDKSILPEWDEEVCILSVWGMGVIVCWIYLAVSLIRVKRKYADARCLFDNVYTHPLAQCSFVGGLFSPKIYLSEKISETDMKYILCHERVHIKRRDYIVKPVVFSIFSLLWFNPLIWVAYYFMMEDMEISCDETVIRRMGEEARSEYSCLLLSMSTGERKIFSQSPAFSAGMVKERIVSVMKYKKPTVVVTMVVIVVVALCSCGIASTPKEATAPGAKEKEKKAYVEQSYDAFLDGGKEFTFPLMDHNGKIVSFGYDYKDVYGGEYSIMKSELVDGEWVLQEEINWQAEFKQMFKGKDVYIASYQFAEDGYLYLYVCEYSMSVAEFQKDTQKNAANMYTKNIYFLKVDEKTGEITKQTIPLETREDALKDYSEDAKKETVMKGVQEEEIKVLPNGNLFVSNYVGHISGLYSGDTGEKLCDIDMKGYNRYTYIVAGDGFLFLGVMNQETKQIDIEVFDEEGNHMYTLPTGVVVNEEEGADNIGLGVNESTLILVKESGIYEAELGDKEFTQVVDSTKDNLYYLSPEYSIFSRSAVYKGENDDYYVMLYKDKMSNNTEYRFCHYTPVP